MKIPEMVFTWQELFDRRNNITNKSVLPELNHLMFNLLAFTYNVIF